ncbi:hypothetical protein EW026_g1772 [Hermanssonia centrifuga]|uniref:Nuclease Le1 n=1 Tax=Hermanssonia centrifuga TaxID=98765 RepID=A0A4S4KQY3_9APHY|nr:hypothetical protein EW026_g1772 [Hermanssonia centrifuga]
MNTHLMLVLWAVNLLIGGVAAWGALGHETVGYVQWYQFTVLAFTHFVFSYVAQQFLAPKALSFVQSSLGSQYSESLGPAATWADDVRSEAAYSWSAGFHFVDAEDSPPSSCSVSESRDCGSGQCILTAIANYTTRVVKTSLSATQRQEALKFIDHFLGDIGQPLHVEAEEVGGNDISAKCSGSSTNLHAAWDTGMLTKNVDANHGGTATAYASYLVGQIQTGSFKSLTSSWLSCTSTTEPTKRSDASIESDIRSLVSASEDASAAITPLECPLVWAQEANAFDCSTVFPFTSGADACTGTYYSKAIPVIDLQLAKQGYRLAAWLNVLFDGATNLS